MKIVLLLGRDVAKKYYFKIDDQQKKTQIKNNLQKKKQIFEGIFF